MRIIIAGGRDYKLKLEHLQKIKGILIENMCCEVASGCAKGADTYGEKIAAKLKIPVKKFPANWKEYGNRAGHLRNKEMAEYAHGVILLPGGRGTANMKLNAMNYNLMIWEL